MAVSTDGRRWTAHPGKTTVEHDPYKVNCGPGFSGESDGWIEEQVDLSPYAGGNIQLRFEYVTDDGPVYNGIFIDDIRIPEIGFSDNVEAMSAVWVANGFIRLTNVLPQEWLLQLITLQGDRVEVDRLELGTDNSGRWVVDLQPGETASLVVSGLTWVTTEPAVYAYSIRDGRQP